MTGKLRHYKVYLKQDGSLPREIPADTFALYHVEFIQMKDATVIRKMTFMGKLDTQTPSDRQVLIHTSTYYRLLKEEYPTWLKRDQITSYSDCIVHLHNARWGVGKKLNDGFLVPARLFDREASASATVKVKTFPSNYAFKTAMQAYRCGKSLGWDWAKSQEH